MQVGGPLLQHLHQDGARLLQQPRAHLRRMLGLQQHVERLAVGRRLFQKLDDGRAGPLWLSEAVAVDGHRQARGLDASVGVRALEHQLFEDGRRVLPRAGARRGARQAFANRQRRQLGGVQGQQHDSSALSKRSSLFS